MFAKKGRLGVDRSMAAICRTIAAFGKNIVFAESRRNLSLSATARVKQILETKEGNVLTIEGKILPDDEKFTFKAERNGACPICSIGLDVKHTDVLILKQFMRSDGCMLPQRITGLCKVQQRRIGNMVSMAQKAGLMPNLTPAIRKKEPSERDKWKAFNTYYDEKTIRIRYKI